MIYLTVDISHKPKASEANVYKDGTRWYAYFDDGNFQDPITVIEYFKLGWLPGYKKIVHHASEHAKIKDVKFKGNSIGLVHGHDVTSVSIYYWNGDLEYNHPLMVQIDEGTHYASTRGGHWVQVSKMDNYAAILNKLDELNCEVNNAHVVNISQVGGGYKCPCCGKEDITLCYDVFKVSCSEFCMYTHQVSNGYVGRLVEGSMALTGLEASKNDNRVYVFCYKGYQLALCMQLVSFINYEFFKRDAIHSSNWTKITQHAPTHPYDFYRVLDIVKEAAGESNEAHERIKRLGIAAGVGAGLACIIMTLYYLIPTQKAGFTIETVKYMLKPKEVKKITMH